MANAELLNHGRTAFEKQNWQDAFTHLSNVDNEEPLQPDDLELLAMSAYLTGNFDICSNTWARAHSMFLKNGDIPRAVGCAFWLGLVLLNKGELARGGGWIGRARKLLDEDNLDCAEQGFLLIPVALQHLGQKNTEGAIRAFSQALEIGTRFRDQNLVTLSILGQGQALVRMHEPEKGVALLDEAMVSVESEELSPIVVGIVYCAVIETCLEIFDLNRAQEWTKALHDWCSSHPHLVPFRGQCLTRRSEIMLLHGEWANAMKEARHAIDLLSKPTAEPAAGLAFYQLGDLYRLQGEYTKAEQTYSEANKYGQSPQPGMALLRLAQGQLEKAISSINRALEEIEKPKKRSDVLSAYIEIMLADDNVEKARSATNELKDISKNLKAQLLQALAAQAEGRVFLAENDPHSALDRLQSAWKIWAGLKASYEAARTRTLIGLAYHKTGDEDAAKMEYEAAGSTFQQLKAEPDLARIDKYLAEKTSYPTSGLTQREKQVLQLIADGKSNKTIAGELFISDRTVERHVSNIFIKLDVSSRTAAAAYAYKYQLL